MFDNDAKEGPGIYTAANGDVYHGEFKGDERYGKGSGTLTSADGAVYTGGFPYDCKVNFKISL